MAQPLPKWIMQGYAALWKRLGRNEFDHQTAAKTVKNTSVILSALRKNGWLTVELHPADNRKRVYRLKSPEEAIEEMAR